MDRERRAEIAKKNGLCRYCQPNQGCNRYLGKCRRPRSDRHKNHRRKS